MAVRFVIGRAGSGKTHHCLESIREHLRSDPVDGPRLILLVPEQASLQMERAIVRPTDEPDSAGDISSAHRAEVLSFRRLAYRVLDAVGDPSRRALTEPARAMVVRHLLAKHVGQLKYYSRAARSGAAAGRLGGFVDKLSATIAELIEEAIKPDDLIALGPADGVEVGSVERGESTDAQPVLSEPVQQAKIHDLHLIYRAYTEYLGTDRLDPSQYLQVARDGVGRCRWLADALLWVDGFASLSGQETLTLFAIAGVCQHVDITVMADPPVVGPHQPGHRPDPAVARLFSRTVATYQDLHDGFVRAGFEIRDPLVLDTKPPPRFARSPQLADLEQSLFTSRATGRWATDDRPPSVELVELPSRRVEVEYAASRVVAWSQDADRGYRCRDIAIIARELEPYHDLISDALTARGIPFFVDRRRPVIHHPLVEFLRTAVAMVTENLSLSSVRLALKTGLWPLSEESADELENYLVAHGIAGVDTWRGDQWMLRPRPSLTDSEVEPAPHEVAALARINQGRASFVGPLESWVELSLAEKRRNGAAWVQGVLDLIGRLGVGATLKRWATEAEADGDLDLAEEHRQVWRETISFLDDLAFAFAGVPLTVVELRDVLEAGLSGLTLGLVPSMVDQVLVGGIERSRHPDIRAAVVLGFNDGVFPLQPTEDSILNDDDRMALNAGGVGVRPGGRQRALDEALLAYVALTRASETVVVTYASADNNGKLLRPSMYTKALLNTCPGLRCETVADPIRSREMWDILSEGDVAKRLALEFRTRPPGERDDLLMRQRWNELYILTRPILCTDPVARRVVTSLDEHRDEILSPTTVERFYCGPLQTSVSELETYAACPFQHFGRYVLRLRARPEAALEPLDVGRVHHAILEDFVRTLSSRDCGFEQLTQSELAEGLQRSCDRVATRLLPEEAFFDARSAYMLRRSAAHLARMIRAQQKRSESGRGRPKFAELSFGFNQPGALRPLELATPSGRRVLLRGYIDRVDLVELGDELLGVVIDYKRAREKRLDLSAAYHGVSLQLLGYLLALREVGETLTGRPIRPIGALFVGLGTQYVRVDHPDQISPREAMLAGTHRPRGLLLADDFAMLDRSSDTGWSDHYAVYHKKDGGVGHVDESDTADASSFGAMLEHTRVKLGELADGILDGQVAVKPYRLGTFSPCSWCVLGSVCRFEMGISQVRFLESLKRSEVLNRLSEKVTDQ